MFVDAFYGFEVTPEWREMSNAILWTMVMSGAKEIELEIMAHMLRKFAILEPKSEPDVTSHET